MAESTDNNHEGIIKEAVQQFVDAQLQGEKPDIDAFVKHYPGLEHQIRESIQDMQQIDALFDSLAQADESDFEEVVIEPDLVGRTIGNFEIEKMIGRGGMGVVYLAHDTKLKRSVAIKSIPAALASNATAQARFRREAQLLASLSHPNVGVIHDIIEPDDSSGYLVLEHIPGETLAERIAREPLTFDETLSMGRQIAEAVSAAHKKGVVHRDLKPGNIKITPDGQVKVLDFGLAKPSSSEDMKSDVTATEPGRVVGTPAYMSPEQARGQPIDKRSDIWSFGCVLYEMLTNQVLFKGETASDTVANILQTEPDWQALPESTPANIRVLLRRCLQKDPTHRLHDIADARIEISETQSGTLEAFALPGETTAAPRLFRRNVILVALVCLITGILIAGVILVNLARPGPPEPPVVSRFSIPLPKDKPLLLNTTPACSLAISPDGSRLVYVGRGDNGVRQLYVRSLNELEIKPIPGTEDARNPFFSPDGQWVGFFTNEKKQLKKVALTGGEPLILIKDVPFSGTAFGSWAEDDTIVFSAFGGKRGLHRISENGETLESLLPPDIEVKGIRYPQVLPGSNAILYTRRLIRGDSRIEVFFPSTGKHEIVLKDAVCGKYLRSGHLIFVRDNVLMGVPFDIKRRKVTGPVVSLIADVEFDWDYSTPQIAVSWNGTVVYVLESTPSKEEVLWVDRQGRPQSLAVPALPLFGTVRLSPDERQIALTLRDSKGFAPQIHLFDIARGEKYHLTTEGHSYYPRWSPDGSKIAFWSKRAQGNGVYCKTVGGSDPPELLARELFPGSFLWPGSWSSDGKNLVCLVRPDPNSANDLWILPVEGERTPRPLRSTKPNESNPRFSPDGRWLAYVSDESGVNEVYLMTYPDLGHIFPVSSGGGRLPIWSRDASELYYKDDEGMMAVQIGSDPNTPVGPPERLFLFADLNFEAGNYGPVSDVSRDGRFLANKKVSDEDPGRQLICVQNWFEELKQLAPTEKGG